MTSFGTGEPHLGHDTLVFPREWLSRLQAPTALTPGFSPWGGAFMASLAHVGRAVVLGGKRWTFHLAGDGVPPGASKAEARKLQKDALLQKRTEVCENHAGTFFTTRIRRLPDGDVARGRRLAERCCGASLALHGTIDSQRRRRPRPQLLLGAEQAMLGLCTPTSNWTG